MRVRRIRGTMEKLHAFENLVVKEPTQLKGKWSEQFGGVKGIWLEIGCGKGQFVTEMAKLHPEIGFVAIEAVQEVMLKAVCKAEKQEMTNIRFLCINAEILTDVFETGEVSRLFLNFSDPWPKKKHYKRRLTYRGFVDNYKKVLKSMGEIHFKTDSESLYQFSLNELSASDLKLSEITFNLHRDMPEGNVMTEYEEKFSSQGMNIFRVAAQKRE